MKLFVVSDIHSFYNEFSRELKLKGFEENNPEHLLICCGDYFDRGYRPYEVMDYLMGLKNKVLIKGNHETLMKNMLEAGFPMEHDRKNGTYETALILLNYFDDIKGNTACEILQKLNSRIDPFYNQMVDYFETKNYIFVHGFIPLNKKSATYDENWRNGDWEGSRWLNGIWCNRNGLNKTGKTIVCGHWHCSFGHWLDGKASEFGPHADFSPYYTKGLIAIDGCTAYSGRCNVIVLEDELIK